MKKTIITVLAVVILLSGIALVIMYSMGDRLIEEVIKSDLLSENGYPDEIENTVNTEENSEQQKNDLENNANSTAGVEKSQINQSTTINQDNNSATPAATDKNTDVRQSIEASPKPPAKPTKEPEKGKTKITADKINEMKNDVSASDKISAAAMVMKRLSSSDINELKSMMSGGLNSQEMIRAKKIAYDRFSRGEIEIIKSMYEKYVYR